jgi:Flp pilus assembly protein CpaB
MQITRKILSTREGTLAFAVVAALLAIAFLLVFMRGYKRSLDQGAEPVTVLVAKGQLSKGSSGDLIAGKGLFQATGFKREQVKEGAITDPSSLRGLVAAQNIVPGQQLTTADFTKPRDPVLSKLGEDQRAVTVPLDAAHGMIGLVHAGDHVDVFAGFQVQPDGATRPRPVLRVLFQDVEVLKAPPVGDKGTQGLNQQNQVQNLVLRVNDKQAVELAFASDNGKVWVALRPQAGATQDKLSLTNLDRLLLGLDPIALDRVGPRSRALAGGGR